MEDEEETIQRYYSKILTLFGRRREIMNNVKL